MKTLIKMISYNTYFERLSRLLPLLHIRRYSTVNTKLCMVWNSTPPTPEKTTLTCKTLQQKSQKEMLCSNLKSLPQNVKPWASNLGVFWCRFEFQHQKQQKKREKKKSTFYHLRNIANIHLSLLLSLYPPLSLFLFLSTKGIKHSFITHRPDYCKAPFSGLPREALQFFLCVP